MSDKARIAAMGAVVEAARKWLIVVAGLPYQQQEELDVMGVCEMAIRALDALPATPAPEARTVTLAVWMDKEDGDINLMMPGDTRDRHHQSYYQWTRLGTVTLPLDAEGE